MVAQSPTTEAPATLARANNARLASERDCEYATTSVTAATTTIHAFSPGADPSEMSFNQHVATLRL